MKWLVLGELVIVVLIIAQMIYKRYQKNKDKAKVRKILNYLETKSDNIDSIKLQKILGVEENEAKGKNK